MEGDHYDYKKLKRGIFVMEMHCGLPLVVIIKSTSDQIRSVARRVRLFATP